MIINWGLSPKRHWKSGRTWVGLNVRWQYYISVPCLVLTVVLAVYKISPLIHCAYWDIWKTIMSTNDVQIVWLKKSSLTFLQVWNCSKITSENKHTIKSTIWSLCRYFFCFWCLGDTEGLSVSVKKKKIGNNLCSENYLL